MPECEFKEACEIGFLKKYGGKCTIPPEEHDACLHYVTLQQHFDSPQFKKQYASCLDLEKAMGKVHALETADDGIYYCGREIKNLIRTQGLNPKED